MLRQPALGAGAHDDEVRTPSRPPIAFSGHRVPGGAPDQILLVARHWLGRDPNLYYRPDVPSLKETVARGVHAAYLPDTEPILVLYDATLLDTGENGFVVTSTRLCWKNLLYHPRQIAWSEIDPASIIARLGRVDIAGGTLAVRSALTSQVAGFLTEMASRSHREPGGPYRSAGDNSETPLDEPARVAHLTALARRYLGEGDDIYYHPAIPLPKLRQVRELHHLARDEVVAVLYDDTVFGSAEEGFLMTPRRLCWKNLTGAPSTLAWDAIDPSTVSATASAVHLMGEAVHLTAQSELATPMAALVAELSREARRG